ncbi:MAG: hypothetical protein QNJ97_06335 [Myxococcota bacterium]|nr:hypothetical protein [Myxococcota bacterium]
MRGPTIRPTVTQRVRAFLSHQGVALRPWSGLDETYRELYRLLDHNKTDPSFWQPLSRLLRLIIEDTTDPSRVVRLPAPQAELLRSWDIDNLIYDLRQALMTTGPQGEPASTNGFLMTLPAHVLGGFLLFGMAACSDEELANTATVDAGTDDISSDFNTDIGFDTSSDTGAADTDTDSNSGVVDWPQNCDLDDASILWTALNGSNLDNDWKAFLCDCFLSLNASWEEGLTELFNYGTPEQIAAALEYMTNCCQDQEALNTTFDAVQDDFLAGVLCDDVPIYKGVSFPSQ